MENENAQVVQKPSVLACHPCSMNMNVVSMKLLKHARAEHCWIIINLVNKISTFLPNRKVIAELRVRGKLGLGCCREECCQHVAGEGVAGNSC